MHEKSLRGHISKCWQCPSSMWGFKWLLSFCLFVLSKFCTMNRIDFKGPGGKKGVYICWWAKMGLVTVWFQLSYFSSLRAANGTDSTFQKDHQRYRLITAQAALIKGLAQFFRALEYIQGLGAPGSLPQEGRRPTRAGALKSLAPLPSGEALPGPHHAAQVPGTESKRISGR